MQSFGPAVIATALTFLIFFTAAGQSKKRPPGVCPDSVSMTVSNAEMRDCYTREQTRVNANADALTQKLVEKLLNEAKNPTDGPVVNGAFKEAGTGLALSQKEWKSYRDDYCRSVGDSWTTGSGAGTAYERCMFELGKVRLEQLRSDFEEFAKPDTEQRK